MAIIYYNALPIDVRDSSKNYKRRRLLDIYYFIAEYTLTI